MTLIVRILADFLILSASICPIRVIRGESDLRLGGLARDKNLSCASRNCVPAGFALCVMDCGLALN